MWSGYCRTSDIATSYVGRCSVLGHEERLGLLVMFEVYEGVGMSSCVEIYVDCAEGRRGKFSWEGIVVLVMGQREGPLLVGYSWHCTVGVTRI